MTTSHGLLISFFPLSHLATEVLETALVQFHVISLHSFFFFNLFCCAWQVVCEILVP